MKAMLHRDVRDIGAPDLVGLRDLKAPQQIRIDSVTLASHAGLPFRMNGLQIHDPHQTLHPFVVDRVAFALKIGRHPGPAIEGRFQVLFIDR